MTRSSRSSLKTKVFVFSRSSLVASCSLMLPNLRLSILLNSSNRSWRSLWLLSYCILLILLFSTAPAFPCSLPSQIVTTLSSAGKYQDLYQWCPYALALSSCSVTISISTITLSWMKKFSIRASCQEGWGVPYLYQAMKFCVPSSKLAVWFCWISNKNQ